MKKLTVNQFGISLMIFCALIIWALASKCQDTIKVHKVKVPYNVLANKYGKIEKIWWCSVKTDYVIKNEDGTYIVNGRKVSEIKL